MTFWNKHSRRKGLAWVDECQIWLLFRSRAIGALTFDANLAVRGVYEHVAAERVHRTEELFVSAIAALRTLVEFERARVRKMPLVAVLTQSPELGIKLASITFGL